MMPWMASRSAADPIGSLSVVKKCREVVPDGKLCTFSTQSRKKNALHDHNYAQKLLTDI